MLNNTRNSACRRRWGSFVISQKGKIDPNPLRDEIKTINFSSHDNYVGMLSLCIMHCKLIVRYATKQRHLAEQHNIYLDLNTNAIVIYTGPISNRRTYKIV